MRLMIAVIVLMVVSVLSLALLDPGGQGQAAQGNQLQASVGPAAPK